MVEEIWIRRAIGCKNFLASGCHFFIASLNKPTLKLPVVKLKTFIYFCRKCTYFFRNAGKV
jgi:hypothetical protein